MQQSINKVGKIYVILIIATLISLGCGKKEIKPSVDSLMAQDALRIADVIKTAYEEKDRFTLRENMSPELAKSIAEELFFEKAELLFTPRMVKITDSAIIVNINWQETWVIRGKTLKSRGSGTLIFQPRTMRLIQVEGDNPFLIPLIRD